MMRYVRDSTLLVVAFLCMGTVGAGGQGPGTPFRGRVLSDETGRPVSGIQVRFPDGTRVITDQDGGFEVFGLARGVHNITLVSPTCELSDGMVLVVPGTTWETQLSFPEKLANFLPELDEQGIAGVFVSAAEMREMNPSSLLEVIRRVAPAMVETGNLQPGQVVGVRGRNRATLSGKTEPIFFLDGVWLGETPQILMDIAPSDVAAMEIMPGAQGAWKYGSSGGMIRIWTWQGIQPRNAGDIDECVVDPPSDGSAWGT